MKTVALLKGLNMRHDGSVATWERLNETSTYDVVAFSSDPPRYPHGDIDLEVRELPWPDGKIELLGHQHFIYKALGKSRFPRGYLRGVKKVCEEFDIIHANENFNLFSIQAAIHSIGTDTKFTFHAGENIPYPLSQRNPVLWQLKKITNSLASGITTTTMAGKRALIHEGVPHDKITILPNSVDLDMFQPIKNPDPEKVGMDSSSKSTINILFVHKICEQKGTPYLLKSFKQIQENYEKVNLILVGENKLSSKIAEYINSCNKIHWIERIPFSKMPILYNLSDIVVLPSVTVPTNEEQFGMAIIEAMACGLPTVVTNVGGLPYVVEDEKTSLIAKERDVDDLRAKLEKLIENPKMRKKLGNEGRKQATEKYSPDTNSSKLKNFYSSILLD